MDTPINLAHQQDRKAEALLVAGKYQEAIFCHQKAADYLLEAMKMTSVQQALSSMELQYQKHLREQKILHYKWERFKRQQEQIKKEERRIEASGISPFIDVTDFCHDTDKNGPLSQDGHNLTFFDQSESGNLVISADQLSVFSISSVDSMTSSIKDEKGIVHDVNTHVRDLEMQVLALTQALEDANRENTRLKNTITRLVETVREKFGLDMASEFVGGDEKEIVTGLNTSCVSHSEQNGEKRDLLFKNTDIRASEDLAELPPLELPKYELS